MKAFGFPKENGVLWQQLASNPSTGMASWRVQFPHSPSDFF
jgi:hypothetical protein